jgi:hypothetical protein
MLKEALGKMGKSERFKKMMEEGNPMVTKLIVDAMGEHMGGSVLAAGMLRGKKLDLGYAGPAAEGDHLGQSRLKKIESIRKLLEASRARAGGEGFIEGRARLAPTIPDQIRAIKEAAQFRVTLGTKAAEKITESFEEAFGPVKTAIATNNLNNKAFAAAVKKFMAHLAKVGGATPVVRGRGKRPTGSKRRRGGKPGGDTPADDG